MVEKGEGGNFPSTLVIVAALNEEQGIGPTLDEIHDYVDKPYCLVVDGNSTDATVEVAEAKGARVIFQKGSGKGDAIAAAIDYAKTLDTRYIVFVDADFTYPAEYLPRMIKILEENPRVGMVCGNRFDKPFELGAMKSAFYLGNRFLALAQYMVNGVDMRDPLTGLRIVRHELLRDWKPKSKGFDVEAELNYVVEKKGYLIKEIPIHYRARLGEKKLKLKHGFRILTRIVAESLM
jgi:glycosyltransferase involved in cell wall biosynthesis